MKVGSLFSGCGLADYGLHQAGFELAWACEIEKQPRAVLRRHFPKAEIHFDVKEMIGGTLEPVELLFFGSPCQDLSVAGKRAGLAGERSGLFAEAMRIVDEMDAPPRICVWENVCGALSSNKGEDFSTVLTEMGKRWSGVAYRVLDLQWFGVPQRRRRVFVVGHSGGWRSAAEVLFEREGLRRNPPTRRKAGQGVAGNVDGRSHWSGGPHPSLNQSAKSNGGVGCSNQELFSQQGAYLVPAATVRKGDEHGGGGAREATVIAFDFKQGLAPHGACKGENTASQLLASSHKDMQCVLAFGGNNTSGPIDVATACNACASSSGRLDFESENFVAQAMPCIGSTYGRGYGTAEVAGALVPIAFNWQENQCFKASSCATDSLRRNQTEAVCHQMRVRRLTPTECERLMGAPDGYTAWGIDDNGNRVEIADGPRYKMIGNGVGVPHSRWIGNRALASLKQ